MHEKQEHNHTFMREKQSWIKQNTAQLIKQNTYTSTFMYVYLYMYNKERESSHCIFDITFNPKFGLKFGLKF